MANRVKFNGMVLPGVFEVVINYKNTIKKEGRTINMTYKELFAVTDLLNDIREGREIKINHDTRVDLAEAENVFKNIIADIDRQKRKSDEKVMYYKLAIEVNK